MGGGGEDGGEGYGDGGCIEERGVGEGENEGGIVGEVGRNEIGVFVKGGFDGGFIVM